MTLRRSSLQTYAAVIRDEPTGRAYLAGSVMDDVGVAVSAWAMRLLMTDLFTDQRERARLMMPMLACFLVGTIVAGPLADWVRHAGARALARWRWRLVVWGRVVETLALSTAILGVAGGKPTIVRVLPYFLISAFMKTALRPTRTAFEVDLLRREEIQVDAQGAPLLDERGAPRLYKVHLLSFGAMTSLLRTVATFAGLLLGGRILDAVHQSYVPLFAFDVLTNVAFIAVIVLRCHPERGLRPTRLRELLRDPDAGSPEGVRARAHAAHRSVLAVGARELVTSLRETVSFLRRADQRPLCWLLFCAWMLEIVNEFYEGRMIVRHVLHGSADAVRYSEITWSLAEMLILACVPLLTACVGRLGKLVLAGMVLDGLAVVAAGRIAGLGGASAIVPFAAVIALDHGLSQTNGALGALIGLAQNSASSAAIRGRIAASYAFVVIVSDIFAEGAATALSESLGIPGMLVAVGAAQIALTLVAVLAGGRALRSFGLHPAGQDPAEGHVPAPA
jgi:hypothetical protein